MMTTADLDNAGSEASYWMRPVSFAGLLRVLKTIGEFSSGVHANALNAEILKRGLYPIRNWIPSATTLYHARNTLFRLGSVRMNWQSLCRQLRV